MSWLATFLKTVFLCKMLDRHSWRRRDYKRTCVRCGAEEWLTETRIPRESGPRFFWKRIWPI